MLKTIDPLLNADVLHALRAMGHGDDLIVADANFPAETCARGTIVGRPLRIDSDVESAVRAILSLMPIDTFVDDAAGRMAVVDAPDEVPPVQQAVQEVVNAAHGEVLILQPIERFAFYERASRAFAVVQTLERRFYGCFAFRKGVIAPNEG